MGYVYGIAFATVLLLAATLPVFLLLAEAFPRIQAHMGWAAAVWLLTVVGVTLLGARVVMALIACAEHPECW